MEVIRRRVTYHLRASLGQQTWLCAWQTIDLERDPTNIGDMWLLEMQLTSRVDRILEAITDEKGGHLPSADLQRVEWSCKTVVTTPEPVTRVES